MRKIDKPSLVPNALTQAQNEIASKIFEKKGDFKWLPEHYNTPIKEELKTLYHNKCAFCETILTDRKKAENEFTIEHFRPKSKVQYYWLGNEWTNLFPLCFICNNRKEDNFPISGTKIKNPPFDNHGNLDRAKCLVTHQDFLNEKPLYIHPEVEDGKVYFYFDEHGKIQVNPNLSQYQENQATEMQSKFLNITILEEKRKKVIVNSQNTLRDCVIQLLQVLNGVSPTDRELKLAFGVFFKQLWQRQATEAEYSLLGYTMITQFDAFFLSEYEDEVKKLVQYAFKLLIQEYNNHNPTIHVK